MLVILRLYYYGYMILGLYSGSVQGLGFRVYRVGDALRTGA